MGHSPRADPASAAERLGASQDWRETGHLGTVSPFSGTQKNWNLLWEEEKEEKEGEKDEVEDKEQKKEDKEEEKEVEKKEEEVKETIRLHSAQHS